MLRSYDSQLVGYAVTVPVQPTWKSINIEFKMHQNLATISSLELVLDFVSGVLGPCLGPGAMVMVEGQGRGGVTYYKIEFPTQRWSFRKPGGISRRRLPAAPLPGLA
eukprot:2399427-Karenia_brevis.AAC.1